MKSCMHSSCLCFSGNETVLQLLEVVGSYMVIVNHLWRWPEAKLLESSKPESQIVIATARINLCWSILSICPVSEVLHAFFSCLRSLIYGQNCATTPPLPRERLKDLVILHRLTARYQLQLCNPLALSTIQTMGGYFW